MRIFSAEHRFENKPFELRTEETYVLTVGDFKKHNKQYIEEAYEKQLDVDLCMQFASDYQDRFSKTNIKKVIFNDPAVIVFWWDDTKTVVKVQDGEKFDKEKGLAMCVVKKYFGNEGNYYNKIRKWLDE